MRDELPSRLPLICPRCRTRTERGREMHTLSLRAVHRREHARGGGAVLEGSLGCDNPACSAIYPIVEGVPLITPDLSAFLASELAGVLESSDLSPATAALLAAPGPDDAPWPALLEHLSVYLDAHWADRSTLLPSPPLKPVEEEHSDDLACVPACEPIETFGVEAFGMRAVVDRVAARASSPVARAIDLGCSVGRGVAELARGAELTVGLDLRFGAVRRARRILDGQPLSWARRIIGRHYASAITRAGDLASPNVGLLCASALDPPLAPGSFGRVAALNVLDAVHDPLRLLSVADGLLAPGGELLYCCPYSFRSGIVDESARPGGADPASFIRDRLVAGAGLEAPYSIEDEADLPWTLRRDRRSASIYSTHYLRARKRA